MEFESLGGKNVRGLNNEFMSSHNCEGIDIPLYIRKGDNFEPVEGCDGNCLNCHISEKVPACGIPDLQKAGACTLRDYRQWSRSIESAKIKNLWW